MDLNTLKILTKNNNLKLNKMRTITVVILLISMMGCGTSQVITKDFNAFYNKYEDEQGVVSFKISSALARMVVRNEDEDANKFLKKMDKIRFFISEHDQSRYYTRAIENYLPESAYNDLVVIKDDGSTVIFKMKEIKQGQIKEIVMTVSSPDSFVAVSFTGNFTLDDAKQMTKSIKHSNFDIDM
jgi:hypothetical protein